MNKRDNIVKWSIISIFVGLYALVSTISTIHVIDFFKLSNPDWLAITLAIAFEIGAAACLGAIIILNKTSKTLVWILFILITLMQMTGNMYYAYSHVQNYQGWAELFGLVEEEPIFQKRILAFISGAILPIVALGFIKSLVDYIRPSDENQVSSTPINDQITDAVTQSINNEEDDIEVDQPNENLINAKRVWDTVRELREEGLLETPSIEDIENEPTALSNSEYRLDDDYIIDADSLIDFHNSDEESEEHSKSVKQTERKLAMAIANDPELKEKLNEAIKKLNVEDKYTKKENNSAEDLNSERRVFGGI
jgi:hypothetical protein